MSGLLGFLGVLSLLHAGVAAFVTKRTLPAAPATLWERLALVSTAAMAVVALTLLGLSFVVRNAGFDVVPLGAFWVGALVLEGLGSVALRRASPRLATAAVFVVLLAPPLTTVVQAALRAHHEMTHWHCLQVTTQ